MSRASSGVFSGGVRTFATLASSGAAVVSILTFLHSWGVIGTPDMRATVGAMGAKWIGVRPLADTARALRDTLHLAATITDRNGAILYGARPVWTSENPSVATVEQDGSVIARSPGATTIIALVGELSARSRIVVHQTVHRVQLAGDSAVALSEGDTQALGVDVFDRRGYAIPRRPAAWRVESGSGVTVDSMGRVRATDAGNAVVSVLVDGVGGQTLVRVRPSPAAIAAVQGDGQRGRAGESLKEPVIARVVNHRGVPVEGTLVRFRVAAASGVVDPAAVVTDADGRARTAWTLGPLPGPQRMFAAVERVDSAVVIGADALPVPANTRVVALRDSVSAIAGDSIMALGVRVTDTTGRPLSGVMVSWSTPDGGRVTSIHTRTDSLGEARVSWTLGVRPGHQRLRARLAGAIAPVTVTAVAQPDPAVIALQAAKAKSDSAARARRGTPKRAPARPQGKPRVARSPSRG